VVELKVVGGVDRVVVDEAAQSLAGEDLLLLLLGDLSGSCHRLLLSLISDPKATG
jgi:hypothetical protein